MNRMNRTTRRTPLFLCCLAMSQASPPASLQLADRLELFVDGFLVERMDNVRLVPARPRAEEIVFRFDRPWEESNGMVTVLKDGDLYRMYYRGGAPVEGTKSLELTCYAESRDGIHWVRPELGLHEFKGSKLNNIIIPPGDPRRIGINFTPMLDDRPGVPADERFKAIAGVMQDEDVLSNVPARIRNAGGLYRFASGDGIRWRLLSEEPLFRGYALDSQNVVTWVPAEQVYAIYFRTWTDGGTPEKPQFRGFRTISRSASKDFTNWSTPEPMSFGDTPTDHLYTNGTHPYFRAPHLLVALPFRFVPGRQVLSEDELNAFGVRFTQRKGTSDTVFMTSRGGTRYDRTFMESYIRPGLDRRSWHARNAKVAKGVVPTGDGEMSLYVATHNTLRTSHLRRYSLPLDRFASVNAPYAGGSMVTKSLTFSGDRLVLNYSTSAAGSLRVEILDEAGKPLPGFTAADCDEIVGDELERTVSWQGRTDLRALAGRAVRLRFHMVDADLYALRFPAAPQP